ncbi:hypothetical protein BDD12DRAFT_850217 [Trichophaea hybrida]|nr:hypothetical protein BDD12DRAFT_850217 [Trichophaea hybrida]
MMVLLVGIWLVGISGWWITKSSHCAIWLCLGSPCLCGSFLAHHFWPRRQFNPV